MILHFYIARHTGYGVCSCSTPRRSVRPIRRPNLGGFNKSWICAANAISTPFDLGSGRCLACGKPILELLHEVQFLPSQHYSTASLRRHGRIYWANGTSLDHLMFRQLITMFFLARTTRHYTDRIARPALPADSQPDTLDWFVKKQEETIFPGPTAYDGMEGCSTHGCVGPQLRIRPSRARRRRR
jgi:hypothetical protein